MTRQRAPSWWAAAAALAVAAHAPAQQQGEERVVQLTVTSVAERSVFVDHGRDIGLGVGSFVRLFPPGGGDVDAEVRAVSQTSARLEIPPGVELPPVGTRGEARVRPPETRAPSPPATGSREVPQHPPWTRREEARQEDQPLLVPTFGQRPDQRPSSLDGRMFAYGQWSRDQGGGSDSQYWLLRTGLRADATNYLGTGERVRFAGEYDARRVDVADREPSDDREARLDLASVAFGTEAYAPNGIEAGRFFSQFLPEIGLVDGVEFVRRYEGGVRIGGGVGAYPRPFPARDSGDDLGIHVFVDYTADAARTFAAAVGLQKTWHLGSPDRDLVLLRSEWRPAPRLWFLGSAKVDYYTGSDTVKGSGLELTELMLQGRWDDGTLGTGLLASRFTWPELQRAEYQDLPPELVRDGFVDRIGWNGSWRVVESLSVRLRADAFRDQDRDGNALGIDTDWRGLWNDSSALAIAAFRNDGGTVQGPGARIGLRDRLGDASWRVNYRWYEYELTELVTGPESYVRQSAEIGLSWPIGERGDLDLSVERWFGDREDALAFSFYLQWRF